LRLEVFVRPLTRCDRRGVRSPLQLWLPLSRDRVQSVSHELNV